MLCEVLILEMADGTVLEDVSGQSFLPLLGGPVVPADYDEIVPW